MNFFDGFYDMFMKRMSNSKTETYVVIGVAAVIPFIVLIVGAVPIASSTSAVFVTALGMLVLAGVGLVSLMALRTDLSVRADWLELVPTFVPFAGAATFVVGVVLWMVVPALGALFAVLGVTAALTVPGLWATTTLLGHAYKERRRESQNNEVTGT